MLDEITEMALEIQPKFLRVLEEGQVRRIGGNKSLPVSVRVVAATNRQPTSAVKEGKLRQDLFYRLNVFHLELPPLRERGEDITLLAGYFLETFAAKYQRAVLPWGGDLAAALQAHSWPGNVRELRNAMPPVCRTLTIKNQQFVPLALALLVKSAVYCVLRINLLSSKNLFRMT